MRRRDHRRAGSHRLRHRHPEALEAGGVDDRGGAAVETRKLLVGHAPEPDDAGAVELRLLAPADAAGDGEREAPVGDQRVRVDERAEVLARLESRHREQVRPAEVLEVAVGVELGADAGGCDDDPLPRKAQRLRDIVGGRPSEAGGTHEDQRLGRQIDVLLVLGGVAGDGLVTELRQLDAQLAGGDAVRAVADDGPVAVRRCELLGDCTDLLPAGRDQAVRHPWAPTNVRRRSSTGTPSSASGMTRRPSGEVGANATTSSPPRAAAAASPASEPRM